MRTDPATPAGLEGDLPLMIRPATRLSLVFALAFTAAAALAQKPPITHEAMFLMKRVSSPVVSPDGRWVVFNVTEPSYDEKEQVSDLWIVPADGSREPRRLTATKSGESGVAWSPDSSRIAFSAKREGDEVAQIYLLDISGGEAQRVTSVSTGAREPKFSPDGRTLLFSSSVFPGAADDEANATIAKERKERKYNARVYETFPIRQWDRWLDDRQEHFLVQSLEPGAKPRNLLAGTKLVGEPGFAGRGSEGSGQTLQAAWAPDGRSIVFVASANRTVAAWDDVETHLYQIAAEGGEPSRLTSARGRFASPRFSPDGKMLYAMFDPIGERTYYIDRLVGFEWPLRGEMKTIARGLDRPIGGVAITPDSRTIYLTAEDAGHDRLYTVDARGGEVRLAVDLVRGGYGSLQIAAKAKAPLLVATWGSAVNPNEVVVIDPAARRHRNLTRFNVDAAAAIDWQPLREFWFTASNGKKIHSLMALPPAFDETKKYPLLVLLHGGPHGAWGDSISLRWNYHLLAAPGYVVIAPNFTGSTGFGERFSQEIERDPFAGPAKEINEAADYAIANFPFIDGTRQAAAGASYGGHLANWMQATTDRYKALVSHAGLINAESQWGTSDTIWHRERNAGGPVWEQGSVWREQNPIRFAANFRTPMLVTIGENDFRVPLNQSIENWSVLQRMKVPSKLIVFPDENHWILKGENSRFWYAEVAEWLERWVK
jgi:dipeptidyl aminopeptidase/acylaminoacyl peptidase